jgi:hypothetical protein
MGFVFALSLGFAPGKTEAAGDIQLECWDFEDQPARITRPTRTVGCTLSWFPVAPSVGATNVMWRLNFECLETGCFVIGNPGPLFYSLIDPPSNVIDGYIRSNCTGSAKLVFVTSDAISYAKRHNVQFIVEQLDDAAGGFVTATVGPPECPSVSGAVGVG